MSVLEIGCVAAPSGNRYTVEWDPRSHTVYVTGPNGTQRCASKAPSAQEARLVAEAYAFTR